MNFRRMLVVVFALVVAFSLGATQLAAQTQTSGGVTGVVTDPRGAVVPDAKVNLKDNVRGSSRDTKSSKAGAYEFLLLDPSNYTITVTATGFAPASRTLDVSLGSPTVVNIGLVISSGGTTVTVTESAPLTQTENGDTATSISRQQITNVPNPGNDLSAIAQLAPGVIVNTQGGFGNVEAFGLPAESNLFTLNGMDDNDPFLNLNNSGATNLLLGQNEIQEADVTTNGYTGSFGTFAGIQVNYLTKSGGNQFHGNANYFWNGKALNAKSWKDNAFGIPKPFDNSNQWSASIGGPIKKDKMFFFFNTEGLRVLIPVPGTINIPTTAFEGSMIENLNSLVKAGDLTAASIPFFCQGLSLKAADGSTQNCPASGLPGSGTGIFGFYNAVKNQATATPTSFNNAGCGSFSDAQGFFGSGKGQLPCTLTIFETPVNFAPEKQVAGRYDWNINNNDRMFVRMQYDQGVQPTATDAVNPLFNAQSDQPEYQGQLVETHSFGAATTNQLLIAATWYSAIFEPANLKKTLAAFPTTLVMGDGTLSNVGGVGFIWPQGRNVTQFQITDDLSKVVGNHTFKVGAKYHRNDVSDHDFGFFNSGLLEPLSLDAFFNGGQDPASPFDASIMVRSFVPSLNQPVALYEVGGYIQDDWKIRSNFTISPAVRVEHASNPICQHLCFANFTGGPFDQISHDANQPYNLAVAANRRQAFFSYQNLQWSPRISFAWQPFGSTASGMLKSNFVVRGGAGIFYDIFPGQIADFVSQNAPLFNQFTAFCDNLSPNETSTGNPGISACQNAFFGFTQATHGNLNSDNIAANAAFTNAFTTGGTAANVPILPNFVTTSGQNKAAQFQKWSLEIQKGIGNNTAIDIGYYGNHGIHEPIVDNSVNAFSAGVFAVGALPKNVTDSRFAGVSQILSAGVSNYNGLVASVRHNISSAWGNGVLQFNYTYGHSFDEVSNGGFNSFSGNSLNPQNPFNLRNNYGPTDYDVRHDINGNYVWELPVRKALMGHGWAPLVDGWQVSGAVFYRTGLPFTVTDGLAASQLGSLNDFGPIYPNPTSASGSASCNSEKFVNAPGNNNKCAFTTNFSGVVPGISFLGGTQSTYGKNGLRNLWRGPSYFDTDMTVMKRTKIPGWERGTLGLGLQFFNLFNHPNFTLPNGNVASGGFGQIFGQVSPPTSILGSFLGGDASPRLIQIKATFEF